MFNFFKRKRNKETISGVIPGAVMSDDQINDAIMHYNRHKDVINERISKVNTGYEPSTNEDKNNPFIWKCNYWKWFVYHLNKCQLCSH